MRRLFEDVAYSRVAYISKGNREKQKYICANIVEGVLRKFDSVICGLFVDKATCSTIISEGLACKKNERKDPNE